MSDVLDTNQGHSLEEFLSSLTETITWFSNNINSTLDSYQPLRTDFLRPHSLAGNRKEVVESVIQSRGAKLKTKTLKLSTKNIKNLLVYEPDSNLYDGAASLETFGFFDIQNTPPWDTWVAYIYEKQKMGYLVCWIPDQYMSLAQSGIDVNPEQCIYWLDESENNFAKLIKEIMKDMQ
jgi:hypothetical protein